ncbi:calcium/sodium antiporter [Salinibacillus aidingensis]|uniref:Calcium/sodium antiporter n=1 Tax=Salinibacillus aidingensis TaxID=237684 RepID=A0ABP3LKB4_9BACI
MSVYIFLVIGFIFLIKGADFFVDGASNIARLLRVPSIIIGLTIVSLGTSSPEATVSIVAALEDSAEVSLGNVIGSNIFNLTLVVGTAAIIFPLKVETETVRKEIPFTLLASVALLVVMSDVTLEGLNDNFITRSDGLIFLLFLYIFMSYVIEVALKNRKNTEADAMAVDVTWGKNILVTIFGLTGIIIGGELVVSNATEIAYRWGMSETLTGLTIVSIGTSLPELVTSVTAALKKESEIALGNIVGSNIFNILFVLGVSSAITPLAVNGKVFTDVYLMLLITVVLLIFSRTNFRVGKREGLILIAFYIAYMVYIILRN